MNQLLQKAFHEAQKLSEHLQNELAQQMLADIENELKWQETLANPDANLDILRQMAQEALNEDKEGKTQEKGFGETQLEYLVSQNRYRMACLRNNENR
jgi:hypothetical protein